MTLSQSTSRFWIHDFKITDMISIKTSRFSAFYFLTMRHCIHFSLRRKYEGSLTSRFFTDVCKPLKKIPIFKTKMGTFATLSIHSMKSGNHAFFILCHLVLRSNRCCSFDVGVYTTGVHTTGVVYLRREKLLLKQPLHMIHQDHGITHITHLVWWIPRKHFGRTEAEEFPVVPWMLPSPPVPQRLDNRTPDSFLPSWALLPSHPLEGKHQK